MSTTITGDAPCRALDKSYRLDTVSAYAFLKSFAQQYARTPTGLSLTQLDGAVRFTGPSLEIDERGDDPARARRSA